MFRLASIPGLTMDSRGLKDRMNAFNMVITEADHQRFSAVLKKLTLESNARLAFLLDKAGQQIAIAGNLAEIDATSLASLTAGNVAATEGVAQLIGEKEFTTLFHEGTRENLHISLVNNRVILLVIFDEHSSLGLVRLRVEQSSPELAEIVAEMTARASQGTGLPDTEALSEITAEDIDALFS